MVQFSDFSSEKFFAGHAVGLRPLNGLVIYLAHMVYFRTVSSQIVSFEFGPSASPELSFKLTPVQAKVLEVFSGRSLSKIIEMLRRRGVDGVVIGSTALELALGTKSFSGDVDVFVTSISLLASYDILEDFAKEHGCTLGSTWLGTPSVTCFVEGEEVTVDFYENMFDFYIPEEIIREAVTYSISGTQVRAIRPEDYVVLKAVAGREEDLEALRQVREWIKSRRLRVDKKLIEARAKLFAEYHAITRRLSSHLLL